MISATEAATRLNGNQYRDEGSLGLFAEMRKAGLVAVFGASDDLTEFRGAIDDEAGSGTVRLTTKGLLQNQCEEDCPHHKKAERSAATIEPQWCAPGKPSWSYATTIPHETFTILEDDKPYCEGIVFALADVPDRFFDMAMQIIQATRGDTTRAKEASEVLRAAFA